MNFKLFACTVLLCAATASSMAQSKLISALRWSDEGKFKPAIGLGATFLGGDLNSNPVEFVPGGSIFAEVEYMATHEVGIRLDAGYMLLRSREDEQRSYNRLRRVPLFVRTPAWEANLSPVLYFNPISTFSPYKKTTPFAGLSVGVMQFTPSFESNNGYLKVNNLLTSRDQVRTTAVTAGIKGGVLINLSERHNLIVEARAVAVFNDNLDGVSGDERVYSQLTGLGQSFYRATQNNISGDLNGGGSQPDMFVTLSVKFQLGSMTEREYHNRGRETSPIRR